MAVESKRQCSGDTAVQGISIRPGGLELVPDSSNRTPVYETEFDSGDGFDDYLVRQNVEVDCVELPGSCIPTPT